MKVKEKQQTGDTETNEDSENHEAPIQNPTHTTNNKLHVEFKETTIIESEKENIPTQSKVDFGLLILL